MQIKVQLVFEDDAEGEAAVLEIAQLPRNALTPVSLGLTLAEAKEILYTLQRQIVAQQVADYQQHQRPCPHCQEPRRAKDHRPIVYRTLFGKLTLQNTRFFQCECQPHQTQSFSPLSDLLPERTAVLGIEVCGADVLWLERQTFG